MDNQKQIEEMIRDLIPFLVKKEFVEEVLKQPFSYFDGMYEDEKAICKELIRLKYRKIPENMVMISREEYDGLKKEAEHYDPFWFCTFGGCEGACKECRNTCEMSIFVKERKETAKEIFTEIGESDILIINTQEYGEIEVVPMERLKEIIKSKGVEVE